MTTKRITNPELLSKVSGTPCVICGKPGDCAHIKSKGSGGDDVLANVMSLCRWHHTLQHKWGWHKFSHAWPVVERELSNRGWAFESVFGIWRLVRQ